MNTYEKNLRVLAERHPELVTLLQQGVDTSHITVQMAGSGAPRLLVTTQDGERVFIHNEEDPLARARETASRLQLEKEGVLVLLGMGLGYLALAIAQKLETGHALLICETDPAIFHTALQLTDLEPLLLSERVKILVGDDVPITQWIDSFRVKFLLSKISLIKYHPCCRLTPELYQRLEQQTTEKATFLIINANTMIAFGPLTLQNLCKNMPWVRRFPGVKQLANLFVGRPAIVAAAGPSLDKNLSLLKEVKGKAVIIAVDTLLGLMLPHEIPPDIVVTLDPQEKNCEKFRCIALDTSVSLVCHPVSPAELFQTYPGKKFVTGVWYPLYQHLARYWEDKGYVGMSAQSVVHMAFDLARLFGAKPIILVGLDLSFPQPKFHAGNLLEDVTLEQYRHEMKWTTDIFGERVETIRSFQSCQHILEQQIQSTEALCIDATEGGVKLAGTQVMRLRDAIDEYCQVEPLDIAGRLNNVPTAPEAGDVTACLDELKRINSEVRTMIKTSGKILRGVNILQKMQRAGQTARPRYARLSSLVEQATSAMKERADILNLLPHHAYQLELYMSRQDIEEIDDMEEGEERLARQLERAQVYYPDLQKLLEPFAREMGSLINHLETEQRLDQALASIENGARLPLALQYKALGHYDRAIPLFEQCLQAEPANPEALYHLAAIYVRRGQFREALPLLETGKDVRPHSDDMHTLHAECQQKIAHWEERVRQVRQVGPATEGENPVDVLLEAGNFYFRVQDLERAKREYKKVLEAKPHLPEVHYLLAHVYLAEGDSTAGVAALEETLKLDPDDPRAYRDLGLLACGQGIYSHAAPFLQKAIELSPDDATLYQILGDIYVKDGAWLQAEQAYEALLRVDPQRSDILQNLAVVYQKQIAASIR